MLSEGHAAGTSLVPFHGVQLSVQPVGCEVQVARPCNCAHFGIDVNLFEFLWILPTSEDAFTDQLRKIDFAFFPIGELHLKSVIRQRLGFNDFVKHCCSYSSGGVFPGGSCPLARFQAARSSS